MCDGGLKCCRHKYVCWNTSGTEQMGSVKVTGGGEMAVVMGSTGGAQVLVEFVLGFFDWLD